MSTKTIFIFTSAGLGQTTSAELKINLAKKFLTLLGDAEPLPAQICFYTDGVRLCVSGSPVLAELKDLENKGVEMVLCSTCLDAFGLRDDVQVGVVGGMGDILTAMFQADKVITL